MSSEILRDNPACVNVLCLSVHYDLHPTGKNHTHTQTHTHPFDVEECPAQHNVLKTPLTPHDLYTHTHTPVS